MNFFNSLLKATLTQAIDYNEARSYVMKGGDLRRFSKPQIERLKELALNSRDNDFYDILDKVRS